MLWHVAHIQCTRTCTHIKKGLSLTLKTLYRQYFKSLVHIHRLWFRIWQEIGRRRWVVTRGKKYHQNYAIYLSLQEENYITSMIDSLYFIILFQRSRTHIQWDFTSFSTVKRTLFFYSCKMTKDPNLILVWHPSSSR